MFKTSSWIKNDNARIIRRILEINGFCLVGYMNLQCTCNFYILWIDMSTHCFCSLKLCLWWFNICDRFQIWLLPDREHQMRTQYDYFACFQVYNLGTGKGYSVIEMAKAFEEASGKPVSPTYLICYSPVIPGPESHHKTVNQLLFFVKKICKILESIFILNITCHKPVFNCLWYIIFQTI